MAASSSSPEPLRDALQSLPRAPFTVAGDAVDAGDHAIKTLFDFFCPHPNREHALSRLACFSPVAYTIAANRSKSLFDFFFAPPGGLQYKMADGAFLKT